MVEGCNSVSGDQTDAIEKPDINKNVFRKLRDMIVQDFRNLSFELHERLIELNYYEQHSEFFVIISWLNVTLLSLLI